MSDYTNYNTLIHGSAYDSVPELWDDEINNSQVFQFGNITTITYTYLLQLPTYYIPGQDEEATAGYFQALGTEEKAALDILLGNANNGFYSYFEDVANIVFSNVSNEFNADNVGALTFGETLPSGPENGAPAYSFNPWTDSAGKKQGDVWISRTNSQNIYGEGKAGFSILLHEIGHSLGLEHPWLKQGDEVAPHLASNELNYKYTVMVDQTSAYFHPDMHYNIGVDEGKYVYSLGLYDIAALQAIYGTNTTTRAEDETTYKIGQGFQDENTPFIYTIWDGGGDNDKIDAIGYTNGVQIDLREGHFSSIGNRGDGQAVAFDNGDYDAGNVSIAYGTEIEDAAGTDKGDSFILNALDNDIDGRGGDDEVDYSDVTTTITATVTAAQITATGAEIGTDTLISIEKIIGGAGIDILDLSLITGGVEINGDTITIVGNDTFKLQYEGFERLILTDAADTVTNVNNMVVYTRDGADKIALGSNLYLADLDSADRLTHAGLILGDSVQFSTAQTGQVSPWSDWTNGVRYAYNTEGDLVIQRQNRMDPDEYTFVAGHTVDLNDSTNSTAGISVYGIELGAYRIFDLPAGKLKETTKTLSVQLETILGDDYTPPKADPFYLDLDGDGFDLSPNLTISPKFDLNGDGFATRTAWSLGGADGFLVVDLNANGTIDDVSELFGSSSQSGFAALAAYDLNADDMVDAAEATAGGIMIWVDTDGDAVSAPSELHTLGDYDIASISTAPTITTEESGNGYVLLRQGTFTYNDSSTGATADVAFAFNAYDSQWLTDVTITAQALALPEVKGHGTLPDLRAAMSYDPSFAAVVSTALSGFTSPDLSDLRAAVDPILNGWVASVSVPSGEPGTQARIDVPIRIETSIGNEASVLDFGVQRSDAQGTYWELASGDDVLDGLGNIIARPTYSDVISQSVNAGEEWAMLSADQITFLERWTGEQMPLGMDHDVGPAALSSMNDLLGILWNELNSVAVRIAMQDGPLSSYFEDLEYDPDTDSFSSLSSQQLVPMLEAVFTDAPGNAAGDAAYLDSWKGVLDVVIDQFRQDDSTPPNTYSFLFQNLVAAYETVPLAISLVDAASVLDIPTDLIITGSGTLTGSNDADIFYMDGSDQAVNGALGHDSFIFGSVIGHDVINELDDPSGIGADYVDMIRFTVHNAADLSFTRNGVDLEIEVLATGETITVTNQFTGRGSGISGEDVGPAYGISEIVFADGSYWERIDLAYAVSEINPASQDVIGTNVVDVLEGGAGDERLEGSGEGDIYIYNLGDGHDEIYDLQDDPYDSAPDILEFGASVAPDDVTFSRVGDSDDLIVSFSDGGNVTILEQFRNWNITPFGAHALNRIEGFYFNDAVQTTVSHDDIRLDLIAQATTSGDDIIYGYNGYEDTIQGGLGNDQLMGGYEGDTYIYASGDGNDVIHDNHESESRVPIGDNIDRLVLSDIASTGVSVELGADGDDLTLRITATDETISLIDQVRYFLAGPAYYSIEEIQFTDTTWNEDDLVQAYFTDATTSGDDYIGGFKQGHVYVASAGNDRLEGLGGGDTYQFGVGSGHDVIYDNVTYSTWDGTDTIEFTGTLLQSDITFSIDPANSDNLLININGNTADSLIIEGQLGYDSRLTIEAFKFSDDSILTYEDVYAIVAGGQVITGDEFDNTLIGTIGDDIISGLAGNDTIDGGDGDDIIDGGSGNDILDGGADDDTYLFGQGYGEDFIERAAASTNNDKVIFAADITTTSLSLYRDGSSSAVRNDITFIVDATGDMLTVEDMFSKNGSWSYRIQHFEFSDGTVWTDEDIRLKYIADHTTAGNDSIVGFESDDVYQSSAGDDYILGYSGADTYYWGAGAGNDVIKDQLLNTNNGDGDTVIFEGLNVADVSFGVSGSDLIITNIASLETLTIEDFYSGSTGVFEIEIFQFADSTTIDPTAIVIGTGGDDVLTGGSGDNFIYGNAGNDEYVFNIGDGQDTITDSDGTDDFIRLGTGIAQADVVLTQVGNNLEITFTGTPTDKITIIDHYDEATTNQVEKIIFDDLSELSLVGPVIIEGTSGDDTLTGTGDDDFFAGSAGNDTIDGGTGIDTILYSASSAAITANLGSGTATGSGSDTLISIENITGSDFNDNLTGSNSANVLIGGDGDDKLYGKSGNDILIGGLGNQDKLYGESGNDIFYDITDDLTATIDTSLENGDYSSGQYDYFNGANGNDVFYVQAGAALLDGGNNQDTYRIFFHEDGASGSEIEIHDGSGDDDRLVLESLDYTDSDYYYSFGSNSDFWNTVQPGGLTLHYTGTSTETQIFIYEQYKNTVGDYVIDVFEFADGTVKNFEDLDFVMEGTIGDDTINGSAGDDYLAVFNGNDIVHAGAGNDFIGSGSGDDTIYCEDGNDVIYDWGGNNTMYGGAGDDLIYLLNSSTGNNTIYGGTGNDWVSALNGIDYLYGEEGDDTLSGNGGDDILDGGSGSDRLLGGAGNDILIAGTGNDELQGSSGDDLYVYAEGLDFYRDTSASNDTIHITGGITINDISVINYSNDEAKIIINSGIDEIILDRQRNSNDSYHFENLKFDDGFETDQLEDYQNWNWGTASADTLTGSTNADVLIGKDGNDILIADAGNDDIHGGSGDDVLYGGAGDDVVFGGIGSDIFVFEIGTTSGFNDIIGDFSTVDGDALDISDLLTGYDPLTQAITDFVQITDNGTHSYLSIDADGGADNFVQIAQLNNITGLTDEEALETAGNLITI